jgi:hypothetical protein
VKGDIASLNGDRTGFIEVFAIDALTVKGNFFGTSDGSVNNGVIRATQVANIDVARMSGSAQIDLV